MEKIEHKYVNVNGIKMHVAEIGEGPAVLFLHGFPQLWYSWRHQMLSLSSLGYRAIAPDLRGYGDTEAPPEATSYTALHIVGDLVGLLNALNLEKVFLVGHDWGAMIAWYFCQFNPDRITALVNLSVAFRPRDPSRKPIESLRAVFGDDYYMCRFQDADIEDEFKKVETEKLVKAFLLSRDPKPPRLPKETSFAAYVNASSNPLPSWLTEDDVKYYASKFEKTGFTGGLNYYRCLDLNWELTGAWTGSKIKVPVKFIVGDLDLVYHVPGVREYVNSGEMKKQVPDLEIVVMEDVAHFTNEEKPEEISSHIYEFIKKF
jgi:pimeloyl-ACP methyl ester carboxylesterase